VPNAIDDSHAGLMGSGAGSGLRFTGATKSRQSSAACFFQYNSRSKIYCCPGRNGSTVIQPKTDFLTAYPGPEFLNQRPMHGAVGTATDVIRFSSAQNPKTAGLP